MAKKQKNKSVEGVKRYLVNVLKENDLYTNKLGYQIEAASSTIVLFRVIRDYILENDLSPVAKEVSRENAIRLKEHPAFRLYAVFDSLLRKDLRALMMNLERSKAQEPGEGGDDELTEMIEHLRDD